MKQIENMKYFFVTRTSENIAATIRNKFTGLLRM